MGQSKNNILLLPTCSRTMLEERSRKRTAAGRLLGLGALTITLIFLFLSVRNESTPPPAADDINEYFYKYAYVIVTYHKSGHRLSHVLNNVLQEHSKAFGGTLHRNLVSPRTDFNHLTKCSELSLSPGTVTIIEAPEFHCTEKQLADLLLHNPDRKRAKWGVKIVHLVRNPFSMAVSNYHYHFQDPTPEQFVHWANPCSLSNEHTGPLADRVAPLLSNPTMGVRQVNGTLPARMPIMTQEDFSNIVDDCESLYRADPSLSGATYYEHLRALPPEKGLRLAIADKLAHIALMASDLIMFHRVQRLEREKGASKWPSTRRELDLITMPLDDWIERPGRSMYRFLDFIFHDHIPRQKKETISSRYEKGFSKEILESNRIMTGKYADTAELIEYLRGDAVFGGPLTRIESLLNDVLELQSAQQ